MSQTPEALQGDSQTHTPRPGRGGHKVNAKFMLRLPLQVQRPKVCPPLLQSTVLHPTSNVLCPNYVSCIRKDVDNPGLSPGPMRWTFG